MIGRGIGIPFRHGTGGGTSIPPEIKKSIIAWYSPYKQKLTNYDVIEAYIEDFTKWVYRDYRGTAKITNNTIVITNVVETNNIVEDDSKPYSDLTIRVTGVTENKYLIVKQGRGKPEAHIKKDGVYTFKDNNLYFGFGVSVIGECNITITQLPTSILKDFSGNKHDAYLYGFKGKLNSGVGIYAQDFKNWSYGSTINKDISTKSYNKFHIVKKKADNWFGFTIGIPKNNYYNQSYKLKFNINKKIDDIKFSVVSTDGNLQSTQVYSVNINNGSVIDVPIVSEEVFNNKKETNIYYDFGTNKDIEIDVELIANYPNQLCYDGKSYAVAYGLPILTDYTVVAERTCVYQTKNKYNEQTIYPGDKQDTDTLFIGTIRKDDSRSFIGCHGAIIVADRSFTEEEINWLKNNLFTIDIPTPAYDFDFSKYKDGSNLGDSITDKYGNVLELHNFAWKGMSGLGGYPIDLKATFPRNYTDGRDYICNDKEITCSYIGKSGLFQVLMVNQDITKYIEIPEFTIKISGSENINLTYHYIKEDFTKGLLNIVGNGIYKIPKSYKADKIVENLKWLGFVLQNHMDENVDLKLEILPIYPGALVFDGIDDYARLAKMTIKTVVLDVIPKKQTTTLYDNRLNAASNWFSILNGENEIIAYNSHNDGFTYINGELNTTVKPNEIMNEKNVICVVNEKSEKANQFIGTSISLSGNANMVLYRITGFTEALTTDQVWKWYQKNKPKGGDK